MRISRGIILATIIDMALWLLFFVLLDKACAQTGIWAPSVIWDSTGIASDSLRIIWDDKPSDNWQTHKNPFLAWSDKDELIDIQYHISGNGWKSHIDSTRVIFRSLSPHEFGVAEIWQITVAGEPKLLRKQRYQEVGWQDIKK